MDLMEKLTVNYLKKRKKTVSASDKGTELICLGRLETQENYLLDILKEQGFYLMYNKKETRFGEMEYWQVLYPIC